MSTRSCSRRDFLKAAGLGASAVAVPRLVRGAGQGGRRPNVLFIHTDSWDGRVLGPMGHPAMGRATPNLDALAAHGTLFENAYCNSPICCPSRSSMFSGLFTHRCEGWNNYKGLEPDAPTFLTRLDEGGYRTQCFGKQDFLSGQHSIRARVSAWTRSANIARPQYRMPGPKVVAGDGPRLQKNDWEDVDRAVKWLDEASADASRPLMLYVGIRAPHPPFASSARYLAMIDESGVTVPPLDQDDHPVMEYQRAVKNWMHGFEPETVRQVRRIYFAMCAEVDAMVGRLLGALDRLGLRDSTFVIFSSDHGENAMEHRQFYKMNLYESSARVPLVVAGPDVAKGARAAAPVSLVDVYPTLMDVAGLAAGESGRLDGHSLMPELAGRAGGSARPDWALSEYHDTSCNTGSFMLRRGDWKYIHYVGYGSQLFNLADDPDEVCNLSGERPAAAGEMDELLHRIVDCEAVDAKVKAYDRASFAEWRDQMKAKGTYEKTMARIFAGWDDLAESLIAPWTAEDESLIDDWLRKA
jgi:arylsulfatase K